MKKQYSISKMSSFIVISIVVSFLIFSLFNCSTDNDKGWLTYRHDGYRSGITDSPLPDNLSTKWVFKTGHEPATAWHKPGEELPRMHSDNTYHVVAANGLTYFGSSVNNKVHALNTSTGHVKWTFFAEGSIRFAPSIRKNRVYFGSDDGYVYCLKANNGKLIWKYRPGPSNNKVIGNGRMISLWPVRTSVLVEDGIVYFGAGVFPYEGIYICALNAKNGKVIWKNDTIGDKAHELQFGGISPHGYLLLSNEILYVPSGRAMPAAFDRKTGEFLYTLSPGSKVGGTWGLIDGDRLIAGVERSGTPAKVSYDITSGNRKGDTFVSFDGVDMVATPEISYVLTENGIHAIDRGKFPTIKNQIDSLLKELKNTNSDLRKIAQTSLEGKKKSNTQFANLINKIESLKNKKEKLKTSATKWQYSKHELNTIILANNKIVAGGKGVVIVLDAENGDEIDNIKINGTALGLAVADECLLVNNEKGNIYCFGNGQTSTKEIINPSISPAPFEQDELTLVYKAAADQILKETGVQKGYCLVLNSGNGRLAFELAKKSDLKIVAIEQDEEKVKLAKENLDKTGLYGSRIIIENWDLESLPDYFANLIVADDILLSGEIDVNDPKKIYRVLKPYGGIACFGQLSETDKVSKQIDEESLMEWMQKTGAEEVEVSKENGIWIKAKRGKLAGAGSWTHQYSNPANTICSDDKLVNYPFGVLWYGEPGPENMVERHARAAAPVAKDGRLFVQGEDVVMAYDSYNGVKLWERNIPGANRVRVDVDGSNLALSDEGILVATGAKCFLLDAETGATLRTYSIPNSPDGKPHRWGYIACSNGTLYGSAAMSLNQDYNQTWQLVEKATATKGAAQSRMSSFVSSQYESKEKARTEFQRAGTKWHFIADFPAWNGGIITQEPATDKMMFSDKIFAMDIKTGRTKWVFQGSKIAHITISIGDGEVYFADNSITRSQKIKAINERNNYFKNGIWKNYKEQIKDEDADVRLVVVLDAETGEKKWERPIDLSGCGGDAVASAYHNDILLFLGSFGLHDKWRFPAGELEWHRITALSSKNGQMLWSRPLNYMVRPVIIENTIIVEPRACDLRTGKIKTRTHPITGKTVPWEYYRPGHTCAVTSATSTCLFYRSYNAAFYDLAGDRGITYFGAIRPGCWINMIPANGLLLFPEASAGCTCSFPLRTTVVMKPKEKSDVSDWSVYVSQGSVTPVQRLGLNIGAPGDKKDENGNLWLGYPRPKTNYGIKLKINETIENDMGYFSYDTRETEITGIDNPWLYTSGCIGLSKYEIPLIDETWGEKPGIYTIRLGFFAPSGKRVFDIKLQDNVVLENFNLTKAMGKNKQIITKEFNNVNVENDLKIELFASNSNQKVDRAPIINFIEIIREDISTIAETEPQPAIPLLKESEINSYLKTADKEFNNKNIDKALELYHTVFDGASSLSLKQKALAGMAKIGSEASLSRIKKYIRQTPEILWDYKEPNSELIDKAVDVYVSIANNLATTDLESTKQMLLNAAQIATELELKDKIFESLMNFGIGVHTEDTTSGKFALGMKYNYFDGYFTSVATLDGLKPKKSGIMLTFKLEPPDEINEFGYIYSGYLRIPKDGIYTFYLESNDGSKLFINEKEIINNDGGHSAKEESGKIALRSGKYPFVVKYFQMGGGKMLKVCWEGPGFKKKEISVDVLFHKVLE
ncbi:PQQ-binding-like beta-propeller repeat protein [candidate division KSB1 bacterium]|nr:PQQ-binding-like beta-propeller repeat protein [candidate division KSB1 bacterium]